MKILITGALGHIGSYVIRNLPETVNSKIEFTLIDDLSTQRFCSLFNLPNSAKYQFIEKRVQDLDLDSVIADQKFIIHLAATTDAAGTANRPDLIYSNNLEVTKKIADACLSNGVPLLFPSSTSVYGSQGSLVNEDCTELAPQSPYADSKIKEEQYLLELFKKGLKGLICRFGTIYGTSPGMRFHTAVNKFCWQAVMGQPLTVWETALDQKRPYLGLTDAGAAVSWIIKNNIIDGRIYNIVSGNHTVRDVVEEIKKDRPDTMIKLVQHQIMNQLSYEVCSERFKATGFKFSGKLSDGVSATIKLLQQSNQPKS